MQRRLVLAAPLFLLGAAARPSLAQTHSSVWTSGGSDPSGWSHDDALARMVADNMMPTAAAREFSRLANARGGAGAHYSIDPIEEGQLFDCMCFGGRNRGSQRRMVRSIIAKPSSWQRDVPKEMRTWTWTGTIDGVRVTVGYAVPFVCGNSSAIAYRKGAPVCVPIPEHAAHV